MVNENKNKIVENARKKKEKGSHAIFFKNNLQCKGKWSFP
jgi:hypothetical protein